MKKVEIKRGDVVEFYKNNQKKLGVIIQNNIGNHYSPTTIILEINKTIENDYFNIIINHDIYKTNLNNILVIDKSRITKKLHTSLKREELNKLDQYLNRLTNEENIKIVYVSIDDFKGSEQGGYRPAILLEKFNLICPITTTTKKKSNMPTHTFISKYKNLVKEDSIVLGEQLRSINDITIKKEVNTIKDNKLIKSINYSIHEALFKKSKFDTI